MTKTFKIGDKIRLADSYRALSARKGATGKVTGMDERFLYITWIRDGLDRGQMDGGYYHGYRFELVKRPRTIARDLSLTRSTRTLLLHLERYGNISPAEAQTVYGMPKIARQIWELRQDGFNIKTELRKDPKGLRYARYSLA